MRYITEAALSIAGDRIERGQEIELTDEQAAQVADLIVPIEGAPEPTEPSQKEEVSDMTLGELRDKAKALGLTTSGSKADLLERIALAEGAPEPTEPSQDDAN